MPRVSQERPEEARRRLQAEQAELRTQLAGLQKEHDDLKAAAEKVTRRARKNKRARTHSGLRNITLLPAFTYFDGVA